MIATTSLTHPIAMPILARTLSWREQQLESMHEQFISTDPWIYIRLGVGLAAVLAIFLLVKFTAFIQQRRLEAAKAQPFTLFMRVQAALTFPLIDRWQMWRLARALRLPHPAAILISPVLFDRAVAKYMPRPSQQIRFAAIRERLFGKA